jgi:hypothetical protein
LACGFPIFDALLDIHTERRPQLRYTARRVVGDLLLPAREGTIVSMTSLEELRAFEGVLDGRLKYHPGETVRPRRASHFSAGFVHVEGRSVEEVEQRMRRVLENFRMTTESPRAGAPLG